jgi:hypothetical protein
MHQPFYAIVDHYKEQKWDDDALKLVNIQTAYAPVLTDATQIQQTARGENKEWYAYLIERKSQQTAYFMVLARRQVNQLHMEHDNQQDA